MKKVLTLLLCFVLLLSLCACGGQTNQDTPADNAASDNAVSSDNAAPADGDAAADQDASADSDVSADDAASAGDDAANPADTTEDMVELVRSYIDKPIEELYAVIGEPESSDYAPSCLGDGDDGMLFYDGFIVYTYREGDTETVYDVE